MPSKVDTEYYVLEMHYIGNYKEFSFIYSSLQCYNENEDCEKVVVERIVPDQETDKDDTTEHEGVTVQILVPIC
jgi:hypothetical protein